MQSAAIGADPEVPRGILEQPADPVHIGWLVHEPVDATGLEPKETAAVAADPQPIVAIAQDREHGVVRDRIGSLVRRQCAGLHRETANRAVGPAIQAAGVRADPQTPLRILMKDTDGVVGQPVSAAQRMKAIVLPEERTAAIGAHPEGAILCLVHSVRMNLLSRPVSRSTRTKRSAAY